jgi:hypothetical protein
MFALRAKVDQILSGPGASQEPCMLPPAKLASDRPERIGHVQSASGNVAVPPVATLTVICFPVGVQVEAAQSAKYPLQIWKS